MKKTTTVKMGALITALALGFVLAGCPGAGGDGGGGTGGGDGIGGQQLNVSDLYGSWQGTDQRGYTCTVKIAAGGWILSVSNGTSDYGTYTVDGSSARLRSSTYNREIGTAAAYNTSSIIVTTYGFAASSSDPGYAAGTTILYREDGSGDATSSSRGSLQGAWKTIITNNDGTTDISIIIFTGNNWRSENTNSGSSTIYWSKGTFTSTDISLTITLTHYWSPPTDSSWVEASPEQQQPLSMAYSINVNTLTLFSGSSSILFTKYTGAINIPN